MYLQQKVSAYALYYVKISEIIDVGIKQVKIIMPLFVGVFSNCFYFLFDANFILANYNVPLPK